jgi:hypothetical protein
LKKEEEYWRTKKYNSKHNLIWSKVYLNIFRNKFWILLNPKWEVYLQIEQDWLNLVSKTLFRKYWQ